MFADDVCYGSGAEGFEVLEVVMDGARWVEAVIVIAVGDGGYGDWTRWVRFDGVEDESGESESGFEAFRDESFTELADWCDVSLGWIWHCQYMSPLLLHLFLKMFCLNQSEYALGDNANIYRQVCQVLPFDKNVVIRTRDSFVFFFTF